MTALPPVVLAIYLVVGTAYADYRVHCWVAAILATFVAIPAYSAQRDHQEER